MTNYISMWMEENDLKLNEDFRVSAVSKALHVDDEYDLVDESGVFWNDLWLDLLSGKLAAAKLTTKLPKAQYNFINSFKGFDRFYIIGNTIVFKCDESGKLTPLSLDNLKFNFDFLDKERGYLIDMCEEQPYSRLL